MGLGSSNKIPVPKLSLSLSLDRFWEKVLRILVPRISGKQKRNSFFTVHDLNRHALRRNTPRCSLCGMRTHTAYGHARPPHPCRFAVLVHAGGCWFPGHFWRWPVAVYARSRVTAAHSVPVCTVETAQGRAHWARPCASGFVRVFWAHARGCVCGVGDLWHWRRRACCPFLRALQLWYALRSMVAFLSAERMVLWSGCYRSHATLKRDGS